jgi:vancomycin resistance protein YoaR
VALGLTAFASTLLAVLLVFGFDRVTNGGEILGAVSVGDVQLGGLGEADAIARLQELEDHLRRSPIPVAASGYSFQLDPAEIDLELDEAAMVSAALRQGRSGNILGQLGWWMGHFTGDDATITPVLSYDTEALAAIVQSWETDGIGQEPYPGDVRIEDGAIVYEYPATGLGIDQEAAVRSLEAALLDSTRSLVRIDTHLIDPDVTSEEIDAAVQRASELIAGDVTLTEAEFGFELVLPRHLLARALLISRQDDGAEVPGFVFDFDEEAILAYVAALGPYLETEPTDAEIVIDEEAETVEIIPSVPALAPDPATLIDNLWAALDTPDRTGEMTYAQGREADFSTADAEALGIRGVIGKFTTNHACCQNRVINIHLMADAVDGAMVMPGETWSLNDHVGQRTTAKGFVCAGALLGNELVEEGPICIGGGSSQFTTTIYNAVFFAGLEDVAHTPHSVYFSRYPEGREATLGWRYPDMVFRNNTPNAVIIKTSYTSTSITVTMYGDNGGLVVEAGLSNRYNHTGIVTIKRQNDELEAPYCDEDSAKPVQTGSPGWTVTVYRYITYPDGTKTTEEWRHRYQGAWKILEWDADDPTCAEPPPETTTTIPDTIP